jgi:hypothetical protein
MISNSKVDMLAYIEIGAVIATEFRREGLLYFGEALAVLTPFWRSSSAKYLPELQSNCFGSALTTR